MNFISLGSGSSGNCYYLFNNDFGILIDQGIGIRKLKRYMRTYGLNGARFNALLVTHSHTDHVKAVGITAQTLNIPVFAAETVHQGMERNFLMHRKVPQKQQIYLNPGDLMDIGPFTVEVFAVPHDSGTNNGYLISDGKTTFGLMTDCGTITPDMCNCIERAEHLVIEANYDPTMLARGPYPQRLQNRITSGFGHSSNQETGQALMEHLHPHTRNIWLCHLSAENNNPELCRKTIQSYLDKLDFKPTLHVLRRTTPSEIFIL